MMNLNWRKPVIYSLLYLSGSRIPSCLKEITYLNQSSIKELKRYQEQKLQELLLHSCRYVPYYNEVLLKSGVVSNGKLNLNNWHNIPILTKDIIRTHSDNLVATDFQKNQRKPYCNSSGGSTGEPVSFWQDKIYNDWNVSNKIFYKLNGGQDIGKKELRIWGSERDLLVGEEKLSVRLRNWLYNRKEINAFKMSPDNMKIFVEQWNKFCPTWVEGYAQPLFEFARFLKEHEYKVSKPRGIISSAGTLYPEMKMMMEEIYECPIYNRYGSREVGDIACSQGKEKLFLSPWNHYVEILNNHFEPVQSFEIGKVYITTLNNFSMPLIRYAIGDIAEAGDNILEFNKVEGRETSVFKTREGKVISGEFFIHFIGVVFNKGFISRFQVIQENYNFIRIKIVLKNQEAFNKYKLNIVSSIKKVMGNSCEVKFEYVDKIDSLKNGKYLYTISKI